MLWSSEYPLGNVWEKRLILIDTQSWNRNAALVEINTYLTPLFELSPRTMHPSCNSSSALMTVFSGSLLTLSRPFLSAVVKAIASSSPPLPSLYLSLLPFADIVSFIARPATTARTPSFLPKRISVYWWGNWSAFGNTATWKCFFLKSLIWNVCRGWKLCRM